MATPRKKLTLFPEESETDSAAVRPPLKWAGRKRWQVSELYPYWKKESHRRLVEPFCGGLAVTLGLMPAKAPLNDINPHLINFYKQLKSERFGISSHVVDAVAEKDGKQILISVKWQQVSGTAVIISDSQMRLLSVIAR